MPIRKSLAEIGCPECGTLMVVEFYHYPRTMDSPEENGVILKELRCQCLVSDGDHEFERHCREWSSGDSEGDGGYDGPDTLEEARGER